MFRNVFTKDLWDRRKSLAWWIVGVVALTGLISAVYPTIRDSDAMKNFIKDFPPEMMAALGIDPNTYLTGAGFVHAEIFSLVAPIMFIAFGVVVGVAATAREESNGTMDMLLSAPVTRSSIILQKTVSLVLLSGAIVTSLAVSLMVMNGIVDLKLGITGVVAACFGVWMLGLVFAAVAMAVGAFTGSPAVSGGVAAGLALLAWFVNAFASVFSWLEIPSKISPFSWYAQGSPLIDGFNTGQIWLTLAVIVVFAAATGLFLARNIATERAVLPEGAARRREGKHHKPRATRLLRSVFGKSLWDRRKSVWVWTVGLSTMSFITFAAWPALSENAAALQGLVDAMPKEVLALFGLTDPSALATPAGFVSSRTYGSVGPIVLIVFAISLMASLVAKEESSGTLDMVMSNNQPRRTVLEEKAFAVFALVGMIVSFLFVVALLGNALWEMDLNLYDMFAANVGLGLLGLCFWGIAIALWSVFGGSGPAIGATAAIAVLTYFFNGLGAVVDALSPLRYLSPFYWYLGDTVPLAKGLTFGYLALAVVAVSGTVLAITRFQTRDLAV